MNGRIRPRTVPRKRPNGYDSGGMPRTDEPGSFRPRRTLTLLAIALASAAATLWLTGDRLPPLSVEALEAARQRWQSHGMNAYHLEIEMEGSELERGRYGVAVDGARIRVDRNGAPIGGDGRAYTVPGLFDLLEQELTLAENPGRGYGAPPGYAAYLFADFDDERGLPTAFRRVVGGGSGRWAEWTIVSFEPGG